MPLDEPRSSKNAYTVKLIYCDFLLDNEKARRNGMPVAPAPSAHILYVCVVSFRLSQPRHPTPPATRRVMHHRADSGGRCAIMLVFWEHPWSATGAWARQSSLATVWRVDAGNMRIHKSAPAISAVPPLVSRGKYTLLRTLHAATVNDGLHCAPDSRRSRPQPEVGAPRRP